MDKLETEKWFKKTTDKFISIYGDDNQKMIDALEYFIEFLGKDHYNLNLIKLINDKIAELKARVNE